MKLITVNKMTKLLITVLVLMACAGNALAQNTSFRIYYSTDNVYVITGKLKKAAQRDMLISEGQVLKLDKNTSVILLATDGTAMPLNVAGLYPFKDLVLLLGENSRSLTSRYFTYVVHEMTEAHEKPEDKLTGGVYRAEKLMCLPYDSCLVIQDCIRFSWIRSASSESLFLTIGEKNGNIVFDKPLRDTTWYYETKPGSKDLVYQWSVSSEPGYSPDATRTFTVASPATAGRLKNELAELEKNLDSGPEFNELIRLSFYNSNHLYIEEYNTLIKALANFPNSTLIREYYKGFSGKH